MELPPWLPLALWFGAVIVVGVMWLTVDIRFRRSHQRRHRGYRTAEERIELFARDPGRLLEEEPGEWRARLGSYAVPDDDPGVERLRRLSVDLLLASIVLVFGGLFASFVLVAALERILSGYALLVIPQLAIITFWSGWMIKVLRQRDRSVAALAILLAALMMSASLLLVTLAMTRHGVM